MSLLVSLSTFIVATLALISFESLQTPDAHALRSTPAPKKKQTRAAYRADLDRVIAENNIPCKVSLDCEAIPLGSKSCGGPTEYVIMSQSTRMKAQAAVSDLTKVITEMDQEANREGGLMGTCEVMVKPELQCSAGVCLKAESKSN